MRARLIVEESDQLEREKKAAWRLIGREKQLIRSEKKRKEMSFRL